MLLYNALLSDLARKLVKILPKQKGDRALVAIVSSGESFINSYYFNSMRFYHQFASQQRIIEKKIWFDCQDVKGRFFRVG